MTVILRTSVKVFSPLLGRLADTTFLFLQRFGFLGSSPLRNFIERGSGVPSVGNFNNGAQTTLSGVQFKTKLSVTLTTMPYHLPCSLRYPN